MDTKEQRDRDSPSSVFSLMMERGAGTIAGEGKRGSEKISLERERERVIERASERVRKKDSVRMKMPDRGSQLGRARVTPHLSAG